MWKPLNYRYPPDNKVVVGIWRPMKDGWAPFSAVCAVKSDKWYLDDGSTVAAPDFWIELPVGGTVFIDSG